MFPRNNLENVEIVGNVLVCARKNPVDDKTAVLP